jgi:rSAM/selenodomain-associated transferase 2
MISVIIPTLNERATFGSKLNDLLNQRGDLEIIVSDGSSSDGTLDVVSQFPEVKVVNSPRGRGRQMNEGANRASGDIFLFLHADTCLPPGALNMVEEILVDSSVVAGSFSLSFDRASFFLRLYSLFSQINHILFTYGDQGLFLRSRTFRKIKGFKDIPIMEDVEIQKRLKRLGKFVKIRKPVITSARRFVNCGIIRQQILNTGLVFLYHLGAAPSCLARFYRYHTAHISVRESRSALLRSRTV